MSTITPPQFLTEKNCSFKNDQQWNQNYLENYDLTPSTIPVSHDVEKCFEPYIRTFEQLWNAYLKPENKLFAEVYSLPVDGMIGIAFYVVDRKEFPDRLQVIEQPYTNLQDQFSNLKLTWLEKGKLFVETLDKVIIVIKPVIQDFWSEKLAEIDANGTIGEHFFNTMPEEEWTNSK
ncbi:MAG: hypothetical protein LBU34_17100 [Planctomycetaceae bacterium]|jgi:hypothetical protein|nr:hypothetical protein [Planctomycetaceae bacterium]